jgi:RNA polymerase sigma-70 factor (ECF subfamily)
VHEPRFVLDASGFGRTRPKLLGLDRPSAFPPRGAIFTHVRDNTVAGAFDRLYARHKGPVYRYMLRHVRNPGAADELFQDVWTNVIRVRATYAPTAKFSTWLYTLAHNRIVDHWRATGQAKFVSIDDDDEGDSRAQVEAITGPRGDEPETRVAAREIGTRLKAALEQLPVAQREAFLLQQEGGLSLAEIARITGAGAETVKSRLRYALARLRTELKDLQ